MLRASQPPHPRPLPPRERESELDADAEAPGGADGDALAQMRGGMHHADGREHGAPRASRHSLHGRLPPRTEAAQRARALGSLRGDLALPVGGPVGTDDLTRAAAHRVPIIAEGSQVHHRAQRSYLGRAHADAEVGARDLEAGRPAIVEHLLASAHDDVGHDVLGTRDVPHDPRERVEILAWAYPHLLVRETGEGPLGDGELVAAHRGRVYGAVLFEEKVACVHAVQPSWVSPGPFPTAADAPAARA